MTGRTRRIIREDEEIGLVGDPEGQLSYGGEHQCAECGSDMTPQGDDFVCTNCGNEQISGADERIANPDNTTTSDLPPDADFPDANAGAVTPAIPEGRFVARKHSLVAKHEGVVWSKHSFDPKGASEMLKKTPVTTESLRALGFVPTRRS